MLRCSATHVVARRPEVGAHPVRVDPQAGEQLGRLRRRRPRSAGAAGAQRRPLGVPGAVRPLVDAGSAAARCRVAASWRCGQRGPADQHRQHRVGLVRHGRRAAARCPRPARRSRAGTAWRRRWRSVPRRRCSRPGRRRARVTGVRVVCHGVDGASPSAGGRLDGHDTVPAPPVGAGRRPARRSRPGCPPRRRAGPGRTQRRQRRRTASRTPVSQPAALRPNVVGTACWVRVRPTIGCRRCVVDESARAPATCARSVAGSRSTASRSAQHQRRVEDVLAGQPAVQPRAASGLRQRASRSSATRAITGLPPASAPSASALAGRRSTPAAQRVLGRASPARCRCRPARPARPARRRPSPSSRAPRRSSGRRRGRRRARTGPLMRSVSRIAQEDRLAARPAAGCRTRNPCSSARATSVRRRSGVAARPAAGRRPARRRPRAGRPG